MTERALIGDDRLPLYQRLADALRKEIVDGERKPGDPLPSENMLAADYALSAGTVRQALKELEREGILERFHGKGTFVKRPNFDRSLFRFFRFRSATGEVVIPESRILRRVIEPAPSHVARQLSLSDGADVISMSRLRLIDDVPVLAEEIWLPLEPFSPLMDIPNNEIGTLLYPVYDQVCNQLIAKAEESLTAELSKPETARLLRLSAPAPLIVVERLAKDYSGRPLEWRRSRGRANQFHYQTEIQ